MCRAGMDAMFSEPLAAAPSPAPAGGGGPPPQLPHCWLLEVNSMPVRAWAGRRGRSPGRAIESWCLARSTHNDPVGGTGWLGLVIFLCLSACLPACLPGPLPLNCAADPLPLN
eukprot:COSAG01_NODE_53_length_31352_cov_23.122452_26_plen_113_part_00